jgi:hypothetical protein
MLAEVNHQVAGPLDAMKPQDQADGYVEHDTRLITTYEALTPAQRETLRIELGFLPAPLPVAAVAGMRLKETAQHAWDVRVALHPDATIPAVTAQLMAEHLAGDLRFMTGFIGKADALATPASSTSQTAESPSSSSSPTASASPRPCPPRPPHSPGPSKQRSASSAAGSPRRTHQPGRRHRQSDPRRPPQGIPRLLKPVSVQG